MVTCSGVIGLPERALPLGRTFGLPKDQLPSLGSLRCCHVTSGNRRTEQWLHTCQSYTLTNVSCWYDFQSLSLLTSTCSVQQFFSIFATLIQNKSCGIVLYVHCNWWSSSFLLTLLAIPLPFSCVAAVVGLRMWGRVGMHIEQCVHGDQRTILSHRLRQLSGCLTLWNARPAGLQTFGISPVSSHLSTGALGL